MNNDVKILRELAGRYAIAANDDRNYERRLLHKAVNDLHMIRPVVLIDELPWNELNGEGELTLHCEDPFLRTVEQKLRQTLYKWNHFPADMIVTPYFGIDKVIHTTGNGVAIVENTIHADETNHIVSHEFVDQMEDESFLERLHNETISYDKEETERRYNLAANIIGDIIPVKIIGTPWVFDTCWDDIAEWHGVTNLLMDLAMRPEFMHAVASKLTDIYLDKVRQYEELNLFEGFQPYLHSTSAYSDDLPSKEFDGTGFQAKDVWGRGAAQVFSSVSPAMREEFDITYMKKAMAPFGLESVRAGLLRLLRTAPQHDRHCGADPEPAQNHRHPLGGCGHCGGEHRQKIRHRPQAEPVQPGGRPARRGGCPQGADPRHRRLLP